MMLKFKVDRACLHVREISTGKCYKKKKDKKEKNICIRAMQTQQATHMSFTIHKPYKISDLLF